MPLRLGNSSRLGDSSLLAAWLAIRAFIAQRPFVCLAPLAPKTCAATSSKGPLAFKMKSVKGLLIPLGVHAFVPDLMHFLCNV